jgi:hypothetical protein
LNEFDNPQTEDWFAPAEEAAELVAQPAPAKEVAEKKIRDVSGDAKVAEKAIALYEATFSLSDRAMRAVAVALGKPSHTPNVRSLVTLALLPASKRELTAFASKFAPAPGRADAVVHFFELEPEEIKALRKVYVEIVGCPMPKALPVYQKLVLATYEMWKALSAEQRGVLNELQTFLSSVR